ncbi:MAG: endo-1,4-beta-xylanase [Bacteroidaceae bacterium]|nr:endo-1,4-beta-xylanase [Bacteroidaceae bacterium]
MKHLLPIKILMSALLLLLISQTANAQLSQNPDKFLGNITTRYSVDVGGGVPQYYTMWNQITCENESKWGSVEGTRGSYNWSGADRAVNYAKQHNFLFKFHALVWGSQYPNWLSNLSVSERYNSIVKWMDAAKRKYPNLEMIDVVNEAIGMHQQGNPMMKESLGGGGKTGYDWLIKAFELAYERWPNAILIYNDYNSLNPNNGDVDNYIDLVKTLRDAGAPIDAYGNQSHDVNNISASTLKSVMDKQQNALRMPMYITELDIDIENDAQQRQQYENIFPIMWEAEYCAGITIWGYIHGATWVSNSGIIKDGKDRPAMTWLRKYMKEESAIKAKSPLPGMKKEASLYIKPQSISATQGDPMPITIRAKMRTKTIDHIDFYVKNKLYKTLTEAPYELEYTPEAIGTYELKAVAVTTDGNEYTRYGAFTVYKPRAPFKEINLPGIVQAEDYDSGADGIAFHDSDNNNEGDVKNYRNDGGGVDIVKGNGGNAIGYTSSGEWLEYTVNVTEPGVYIYEATVSSGTTGSSFKLSLVNGDKFDDLTDVISVPQTGSSNWDTYRTVSGRLLIPLPEGKQILHLDITGSSCNIDKIKFRHVDLNDDIQLAITADPAPATVGETTVIKVEATAPNTTIASVKLSLNDKVVKTFTAAPYEYNYKPSTVGSYEFTAVAIDSEGKESNIASYVLKVNNKRTPYKSVDIPGIFEAENFDKGGEGFTFHDSDSEDESQGSYRSDKEGVEIVSGNGGYALGYTVAGEWYEYTVNVTAAGTYKYKATVSSGNSSSSFSIGLSDGETVTELASVSVPQTGDNDWGTYKTVEGTLSKELALGKQTFRITIVGAYCNIDKIELICTATGINDITNNMFQPKQLYNISGQRINTMQRGINIVDGKKIFVK